MQSSDIDPKPSAPVISEEKFKDWYGQIDKNGKLQISNNAREQFENLQKLNLATRFSAIFSKIVTPSEIIVKEDQSEKRAEKK